MSEKIHRSAVTGEFVTDEYAEANPDTTVTESIEFSKEDIADLEAMGVPEAEIPNFHPILEIWQKVLEPATAEAEVRPTPQWCNRIVTQFVGVTYADMYTYRDSYFGKLKQLKQILDDEIATDKECFNYSTPEEDRVENYQHYKNLLLNWQLAILDWELDWDCINPDAGVEIAVISEVHKMFFEPGMGIVQFLENIQLEFTDADQAELGAALMAHKAEVLGE